MGIPHPKDLAFDVGMKNLKGFLRKASVIGPQVDPEASPVDSK